MTEMTDITDDEIAMALDVLERFKEHEADSNHRDDIEDVREMLQGVYDYRRALPSDGEIAVLERVLTAIDPEEQRWHDVERVEDDREHGLDLAENGIEYFAGMWPDR